MILYESIVKTLVADGTICADDRVLAVCAGNLDRQVFLSQSLSDVTISNLRFHAGIEEYAPFIWERQDAEQIEHSDDTFDWVTVHMGLHHCASPHKALCEMLRVARRGVLVVENRDSALMRIAVRLGWVPEYELEPCAVSGGKVGGFRDTLIPNHIYRWTEREVEKTVRSSNPGEEHMFRYFYEYRFPRERLAISTSALKRTLGKLSWVALPIAERLAPKQGNAFGFCVIKSERCQPWLRREGGQLVPNMDYISSTYDTSKYGRRCCVLETGSDLRV